MNIRKQTVSKRRFHAEYPLFEADKGENAGLANAFSKKLMSLLSEEARRLQDISFTMTCDIRQNGIHDEICFALRGSKHGRRVIHRRLHVVFLSRLIKEFEIFR